MMTPQNQDQQGEGAAFKIKIPLIPSPGIKNQEFHLHKNKTSIMSQTFKLYKVYSTDNKIQTDHAYQNSNQKK